ncbi:MAG: DsbE family thiol:disulfide interchange protein [Parvibaculum sp.]|jgi:cytochrome c biogenesis protein CcmG/thiol:disulfide interchange protein DsbE|nr:DsbE family thiol:disulfide interchange protein [Parvibaculum sp.]|tara:strand:+ start:559 stop:1140 length:582 start_codon:yes stop_codon:yes gene_type:complete
MKITTLLPVAGFFGVAALFFFAIFGGDPSEVPSALLGKPVPEFTLPAIADTGVPGFATDDLKQGEVTVVNVWASWCVPCRQEHPLLEALARESGAPIFGLNYKDSEDAAQRFLATLGNPFTRVGADRDGRVSIDWGVYGVPETFVVDGEGMIVLKHVGAIDRKSLTEKILPAIERARSASLSTVSSPDSGGTP